MRAGVLSPSVRRALRRFSVAAALSLLPSCGPAIIGGVAAGSGGGGGDDDPPMPEPDVVLEFQLEWTANVDLDLILVDPSDGVIGALDPSFNPVALGNSCGSPPISAVCLGGGTPVFSLNDGIHSGDVNCVNSGGSTGTRRETVTYMSNNLIQGEYHALVHYCQDCSTLGLLSVPYTLTVRRDGNIVGTSNTFVGLGTAQCDGTLTFQ